MSTLHSDATPVPNPGKRWVKPFVEEIALEPTDDVLGACWTSSTSSPTYPACTHVTGCYL